MARRPTNGTTGRGSKKSSAAAGARPEAPDPFDTPEKSFAEAERLIAEAQGSRAIELTIQLPHLETLPGKFASLTALRRLSLTDMQVTDLGPLASLTALQRLRLNKLPATDLGPLANLTTVVMLELDDMPVTDLGPLANLAALETLRLGNIPVSDLGPLAKLKALEILWLGGTQVDDLAPLASLAALDSLWLHDTPVADLAPVAGLTRLRGLWLHNTQVADLGPLARLTGLQSLSLDGTHVADLSPLASLTSLIDGVSPKNALMQRAAHGLSYERTPVAQRAPFKKFVRRKQPARTVETISYLRRAAGLPEHQVKVPDTLEIPPTQPAAIEPMWREGRLTIPSAALQGDLDKPDLDSALQALRQQIKSVADAAKAEGNIDKRVPAYLDDLANAIPESTPAQHELFRLAHELAAVQGYAKTVGAECSDILAVRYNAMALAYEQTMRQFPKWRQFVRNAAKDSLKPEQIEIAPELAHVLTEELRDADAENFIATALVDAINSLAEDVERLEDALVAPDLEQLQEELALDLLIGLNNVVKRISVVAIQAWELLPERERASLRKSIQGFRDRANHHVEKLGPDVVDFAARWLRRTAKGALVIGGSGLLAKLIAIHPMFEWLSAIVRLFG